MRFILAFVFLSLSAHAKDSAKEIESVMAKYRKAPAVKAKVKKTVVQETMGMETKSEGTFYFSKGKLRLEFSEPEKTTLVYDGKFVWLETQLDEKTVQVTKMHSNELKRSKSVLTALFEKKNILRAFKLLHAKGDKTAKTYTFEPKKDKDKNEVLKLEIALAKKDLQKISYKDQLENTVTFEFSELTRDKVPASKFSYKPPKNAEVTVIK